MNQIAIEFKEPLHCRQPKVGTQAHMLLMAFYRGERLSVLTAIQKYGVYALSQRCGELKRLGWPDLEPDAAFEWQELQRILDRLHMTLPQVDPTDQVIAGRIVNAGTCHSCQHKAGSLTAALDNMGKKGVAVMLQRMKLETAMDVVEWLNSK
jgi:hypothetical protein